MFRIMEKYEGCTWEEIDSFDTMEEATKMLEEYIRAFGKGWVWKVVKI